MDWIIILWITGILPRRRGSTGFWNTRNSMVMTELEKQVRQRYKDDLSGIALRLNKAQTELELAEMLGVCVPLTSDEEAYQTIRTALIGKLNERR